MFFYANHAAVRTLIEAGNLPATTKEELEIKVEEVKKILTDLLMQANGRTVGLPPFRGKLSFIQRILFETGGFHTFASREEFETEREEAFAETRDRRKRVTLGHDVGGGNVRITGKTERTGNSPTRTRLRKAYRSEEDRVRREACRGANNGGGQQKQKVR